MSDEKNAATIPSVRPPPSAPARPQLLVIAGGRTWSQPLPDSGEVTIGRTDGCDVVIDDPSISRRHAVLRIGPPLMIEDLGSANGSRVRDHSIEKGAPVPIAPGEVVDLGSVMVIVQHGAAAGSPRRIWSHGYFEVRLEDECARAARSGGSLALLRVVVDRTASNASVPELVMDAVHREDVVGIYGPGDVEVLLVGMVPADAGRAADDVERLLRLHGASVRIGLACYPRDARSAWELVARAGAVVRPPVERSLDGADLVVPEGPMRQLHRLAERIAAGFISVLILGETGVGKEVMAETVHRLSPRKDRPFLRLNCAALSESLLESELFGHEKGAFTGAVQTKPGLLETADRGTVFLDEVGELPMSMQVKLLRVLEERQVLRVGGLKPRAIDVRFVAATNRDLEAEVARGTFRQDLYYRINGISLVIPPLRQRVSEIAGLARAFVGQSARALGRPAPEIAPQALALLEGYGWPGNIRELRNFVERAVLLCGDGPITEEHLPVEKMRATITTGRPAATAPPATSEAPRGGGGPIPTRTGKRVGEVEREEILDALERGAGNQKEAARLLGVSRRTLSTWLDTFDIPRPRKGR